MRDLKIVLAFLYFLIKISHIHSLGTNCSAALSHSQQTSFWLHDLPHGISAFNSDPTNYKVFRNVKDYGAKGDGTTDDTAAINKAVSDGSRCGQGCAESTLTPAVIYFPEGKYVLKGPIVEYYYTQLVGDPLHLPTLIMHPDFSGGIGLVDSDPYANSGNSWWVNQDNFYRQVRNFIIDTTRVDASKTATGIHWQVAQATSVTNVHFRLSTAADNKHQGIWMENGSGGFMSDLTFHGGKYALWVGNQQFTSRNLTISNCDTGVYMNWNWGWTFKGIKITDCKTGFDITSGGDSKEGVGSILVMDSQLTNVDVAVKTVTTATSQPHTAGSLILDHVQLSSVKTAVGNPSGTVLLEGGSKTIDTWVQGQVYDNTGKHAFSQTAITATARPAVLLDSSKNFFEKPKPAYLDVAHADFVNVKSEGAKGDGKTDDTKAIADTLAKYAGCKVIYFPTGTYLVSDTVLVPAGSRLVGEVWSTISATGKAFSDAANPKPVFKIGNANDQGVAELSELIFSTHGPAPGAILVQINIRDPANQQGAVGMWDVHFRVGGARGTNLEDTTCGKSATIEKAECFGAFLMLHVASTGSAYLENVWAWVADHDLDGNSQISVYNGRGILIESANGPVWMYGTASEHSVLYQYQISNAKNVIMAMIQTETPYYQAHPPAPRPFTVNKSFNDPDFSNCASGSATCPMAWGLRIVKGGYICLRCWSL